ncbi:MAG: tetratricopeptide repeat protein [Ktedonobacterales bacterium]
MEIPVNNRRVLTSPQWRHGAHAEDAHETLGLLLRRLRLAAGLTQEQLAERSGVSVYSISNIERGVPHRPRPDTLRILTQALQLSQQDAASLIAQASHIRRNAKRGKGASEVEKLPAAQTPDVVSSLSHLPLIGRERDIEAIDALLDQADTRLISLVGPAGVGKTRLAMEVVRRQRQRATFSDGCICIDLVPLRDTRHIITTLAQAIGLPERLNMPALQALKNYWREKTTLVLLDNFEHILPAATVLSELLACCPGLRLLITSRRRLNIRGERVFAAHPLALPALAPMPSFAVLQSVPSIALFVRHAQTHRRDFDLTDENASVVAQICHHLDGLPLALELAAARMALFAPHELLTRLESREAHLHTLAGGPQDAPARQRTLRAALAWSYDLLSAEEQRLFQTLAVFQSYPTCEAALAIYALAHDTAPSEGAHDALLSLIESSLVNTRQMTGSAMRIGLFEMVREYARERAAQDGYLQRVQEAHACYYMEQAESAAQRMQTFEESVALRRLDHDLQEMRTALTWACKEDTLLGVRLAIALRPFWVVRGYVREGLEWCTALLLPTAASVSASLVATIQDDPTLPQSIKAQALVEIGLLYYRQGANHDASALLHAGLELHNAIGDDRGAALALNAIGIIESHQGDLAAAQDTLQASLVRAGSAEDTRGKGLALLNLAAVAWSDRRYDDASRLYEQGLACQREVGDLRQVVYSLQGLANIAYARKEVAKAQAIYLECLNIQRDLGVAHGVAYCLNALGQLAHCQGDDRQARAWLKDAHQAYYRLGDTHGIAKTLSNQGDVQRAEGQDRKAFSLYQESLRLFHQIDERASYLEVLLEIASVHPDDTIAAHLLGATKAACDAIGATFSGEEASTFHLRSQRAQATLGAAAFERLYEVGQFLTLDDMVALALQPEPAKQVVHSLGVGSA